MLALTLILHLFIGSLISGTLVTVALVVGTPQVGALLTAALAGLLLSFPVSWLIARALSRAG